MPRPYKDKIPPKSEQFGFGGDVKSEILNHSVPKAPFPAGRQTQGLGNRGGSDSGWGKGWRHPHHEPVSSIPVSLKGSSHLAGRPRRYKVK